MAEISGKETLELFAAMTAPASAFFTVFLEDFFERDIAVGFG
ncbi:hypothetical protein ACSBL2_09200 [Pedobacter sp. AW31-3R]